MFIIPSSSSFSSTLTSKFLSFISPTTTTTNQTQLQSSSSSSSMFKFPTFSPSISLKSNRSGFGFMVTNMGTYNVQVVVENNEPEERLLGRFRREVFRAGVIQETKRRRFFENSQDKRKRKTREAAKKYRPRRPRPKVEKQDKVEDTKKKQVYNSDEDDWDLPDGDLP